jgi:hypothetical protein
LTFGTVRNQKGYGGGGIGVPDHNYNNISFNPTVQQQGVLTGMGMGINLQQQQNQQGAQKKSKYEIKPLALLRTQQQQPHHQQQQPQQIN